jgi:FHS family L-fucose permease-like MFS transporter
MLGEPRTASSRLVLAQAFNSLGTTIGPFVGSILILRAAQAPGEAGARAADVTSVQGPYLALAASLFAMAVVIAMVRLPRIESQEGSKSTSAVDGGVWRHRHLVLGAIAVFCYVGAEVAIGSLLVNFMGRPDVAGLSEETAGKYLSLYWGGAMVGRFIGAGVLIRVRPGRVLAVNAIVAALLLACVLLFAGKVAMWSLLAIGLLNSIMFPTIFTLAIADLGIRTGAGSGVLCMAIVGGAVVPVLQGMIADGIGLLYSFVVPLVCYLYIAHYGSRGHEHAGAPWRGEESPVSAAGR